MTESREPPLRIGVVGVGFGASVHIPAFKAEGVDVVAVCARHQERAERAAKRFGIPNAFSNYAEMLRLNGLDAVSIATPPALHYEMSLEALDAGKHVICEKPLADDAGQAREMWNRARSSSLTAMVAHEFRFARAVTGAKLLLEHGYIGELHMCLIRLVVAGPRKTDGAASDQAGGAEGLLNGIGSHYIDCLRYWFGEVESVSGELSRFDDGQRANQNGEHHREDTFQFTLNFVRGGFANMLCTLAAPFGSGASMEIYGSAGTLVAPPQAITWRALSPRGRQGPVRGRVLAGRVGDHKLQELPVLSGKQSDRDVHLQPFRLLVREFVRGVKSGVSPAPNFYDGMRCQEILDAVRRSAVTGERIVIPGAVA